jgi:3-oxoacyl-[acyl-carrier protein] reductase
MIDLKNLNVLLTGATGIIGGSILQKLHQVNANIIATGTNPLKLQKIEEQYSNITIKKFDISNHSKIESFVDECNEIFNGKLDVLINNAGITSDNLSIRMKDDEWNKVINLNLSSSFFLSKHTIKKMLKNKNGKIINITSIVGHTGNVGQSNYAASKAGLIGMSKSLALEYGKKNIKVNCVSPGFIKSEMTDKISEDFKKILEGKIALERLGLPEDVANTVIFLSSSLSDYITGETIHVNGGMYFS